MFNFEVFKNLFQMGNGSPSHLSPNFHFNLEITMPKCNEMGWEAIERLCFLASLPLACTGQMEGGEITQPLIASKSRSEMGLLKHQAEERTAVEDQRPQQGDEEKGEVGAGRKVP